MVEIYTDVIFTVSLVLNEINECHGMYKRIRSGVLRYKRVEFASLLVS